jgi:hypothetical protein
LLQDRSLASLSCKDEVSSSKKLIREYINQAKRRGFIDWKSVNHAVVGAEMTSGMIKRIIPISFTYTK